MTAPKPKADASSRQTSDALRVAAKEYAKKEFVQIFADSRLLDQSDEFPKFNVDEVTLGKILGKGGFGTVYEVRGFEAGKTAKPGISTRNLVVEEEEQVEMESCAFIADHCIRKGGDARYAAKVLSPEVTADIPTFIQGSIDMAIETRVLSAVEHPNIIKMRACAKLSPFDESYFIVMDRLYDTMEKRMGKWARRGKRLGGVGGKLFDLNGLKKRDLMEEKVVAAFDLCAAIGYLHKRNILYRDLKPENIGFDIRDDVKLFDFGLAKEITSSIRADQNGMYNLTGLTGSPRYMAPEVGNEQHYNNKCDTYSFGILFWQIYSDKVPFEVYGMSAIRRRVWNGEQKRPFVQENWPVPIKTLLRRSWSPDVAERPTFDQLYKILRQECVRLRGGKSDGLEHTKRRSTFVFRGGKGRSTLASIKSAELQNAFEVVDEEEEE